MSGESGVVEARLSLSSRPTSPRPASPPPAEPAPPPGSAGGGGGRRMRPAARDRRDRRRGWGARSTVFHGVGRVVHRPGLPRLGNSDRHVLLEFTDHLGSSIATIDHATGELVERSTYQVF